jgi:predicted RNA methylase
MLGNLCVAIEGMTVADVDAGTGLLMRGLLKYGYQMVAVEPHQEMRRMR